MRPLLDVAELAPASPELQAELDRLSTSLKAHVAAYRVDARGRALGLCAIYEAAPLSDSQLARLRDAEVRWPQVLFLAYTTALQTRRS